MILVLVQGRESTGDLPPPQLSQFISLANSWPLAGPLLQALCYSRSFAISLSSPESTQPIPLYFSSLFAQVSLFSEVSGKAEMFEGKDQS